MKVELERFDNTWYRAGRNKIVQLLWYFTNVVIFNSGLLPFSPIKCSILRAFGAKVGKGVVIKPYVNIKYPWNLEIGAYSWIGEGVWIDNLAKVIIGMSCCVSQGALLLTGNHDYTKPTFDLMIGDIELKNGAWIGAKSIVCPGIIIGENAILTVGSIASKPIEANSINKGNPAIFVKKRILRD